MTVEKHTIAQAYAFPSDSPVTVHVQVVEILGTRERSWGDDKWTEHRYQVQDSSGQVELGISRVDFEIVIGSYLRAGPSLSGKGKGTHVRKWETQSGEEKWALSCNGNCVKLIDEIGNPVRTMPPASSAPLPEWETRPSQNIIVGPPPSGLVHAVERAASNETPVLTNLSTTASEHSLLPARLTVAEHRSIQEWLMEEWRRDGGPLDLSDEAIAALTNTTMIALTRKEIERGLLPHRKREPGDDFNEEEVFGPEDDPYAPVPQPKPPTGPAVKISP